jgi:hypothetical protein
LFLAFAAESPGNAKENDPKIKQAKKRGQEDIFLTDNPDPHLKVYLKFISSLVPYRTSLWSSKLIIHERKAHAKWLLHHHVVLHN